MSARRAETGLGGVRAAWLAALLGVFLAGPGMARDVLGVFGRWGAFRDAADARCFAIAEPSDPRDPKRDWSPFASVGFWPRKNVRGQINIRLSQAVPPNGGATLIAGGKHFQLGGGGADVWSKDQREDAAIVAALRAGGDMAVHGHNRAGATFSDHYELRGAATAIDAAALGCARAR